MSIDFYLFDYQTLKTSNSLNESFWLAKSSNNFQRPRNSKFSIQLSSDIHRIQATNWFSDIFYYHLNKNEFTWTDSLHILQFVSQVIVFDWSRFSPRRRIQTNCVHIFLVRNKCVGLHVLHLHHNMVRCFNETQFNWLWCCQYSGS